MELTNFPAHCGTRIIVDFWTTASVPRASPNYVKTFIGIFVDSFEQKRSYLRMKSAYKILYQSPIIVNPGTNREYFIVIWLNEKP